MKEVREDESEREGKDVNQVGEWPSTSMFI